MKVLCIKDDNRNPYTHRLEVGSFYTIIGSVPGYESTHVQISEHPISKRGYMAAYRKDCFASLSDIDETELVNEKETVNA